MSNWVMGNEDLTKEIGQLRRRIQILENHIPPPCKVCESWGHELDQNCRAIPCENYDGPCEEEDHSGN